MPNRDLPVIAVSGLPAVEARRAQWCWVGLGLTILLLVAAVAAASVTWTGQRPPGLRATTAAGVLLLVVLAVLAGWGILRWDRPVDPVATPLPARVALTAVVIWLGLGGSLVAFSAALESGGQISAHTLAAHLRDAGRPAELTPTENRWDRARGWYVAGARGRLPDGSRITLAYTGDPDPRQLHQPETDPGFGWRPARSGTRYAAPVPVLVDPDRAGVAMAVTDVDDALDRGPVPWPSMLGVLPLSLGIAVRPVRQWFQARAGLGEPGPRNWPFHRFG